MSRSRPVGRQNVVVIYAENRSFDNLYGNFPGANGLQNATAANSVQKDRDGSTMATLPKIWGGLTATGITPAVTEAMTANLPTRRSRSTIRKASTSR